jgi:hypothetical protein
VGPAGFAAIRIVRRQYQPETPQQNQTIPVFVDAFAAVVDNSIIAEKIGYNRGLREKK